MPPRRFYPLGVRRKMVSAMYYWNRENFEGLASLSSALRIDSRLECLATYCELREQGLRKQALAQLDAFLDQARSWDVPTQRELALHVLESHWKTPQAHQFLADPLRTRFLEPVLEHWREAEADNPVSVRHLALLRGDLALLDEALRMNPEDDFVRAALAEGLIGLVEYATHHLVEGNFIGDEREASAALDRAASVLAGISDASRVHSLKQAVEGLSVLLADWQDYRESPEGSFPEWCRSRNRNHKWRTIIYYDQ